MIWGIFIGCTSVTLASIPCSSLYLSNSSLDVLSIYGSEDKVLNLDNYNNTLKKENQLPLPSFLIFFSKQ